MKKKKKLKRWLFNIWINTFLIVKLLKKKVYSLIFKKKKKIIIKIILK